MTNRLEPFAAALKKEKGIDVELFNEAWQKEGFVIDGKKYSWIEINNEWKDLMKKYYKGKNWIPYDDPNGLAHIKETLMYKADMLWMEKLKKEGYTIIDIDKTYESHFYDMELNYY